MSATLRLTVKGTFLEVVDDPPLGERLRLGRSRSDPVLPQRPRTEEMQDSWEFNGKRADDIDAPGLSEAETSSSCEALTAFASLRETEIDGSEEAAQSSDAVQAEQPQHRPDWMPPEPSAPSQPRARAPTERPAASEQGAGQGEGEHEASVEVFTTIMLRNLPNNYNRQMVIQMLVREGFGRLYDFLYLPMDFKTHASFGYCFVNLIDHQTALRCWSAFDGYSDWMVPSKKRCYVSWSTPHQGLKDHVTRYRGSAVMRRSVPDEYKPMLFRDGTPIPFPPRPAKEARARKGRSSASSQQESRAAGTAESSGA